MPVLDNVRNESTQTITKLVQNTIQLNSIYGDVAWMNIVLRASKLNASGVKRTFQALSTSASAKDQGTIDLVDATGQSVLGSGAVDANLLRHFYAAKDFPGVLYKNLAVYPIVFSSAPIESIKGKKFGSRYFSSDEKLHITPYNALTSGTFLVSVFCKVHRHIESAKGKIISKDR